MEYVQEDLIGKARRDEAVIIATRSIKKWGLVEHENIVTYENVEARSAHLTPNSRGGKAIAERLGLNF